MDKLKDVFGMFGKGIVLSAAPRIGGGVINDLFHMWKVDVPMITEHVENNVSLWVRLGPEQRKDLMGIANLVGNLDFITPELVINGIKKDFPKVASLLLSWDDAQEWLARQIEDLKKEVTGT